MSKRSRIGFAFTLESAETIIGILKNFAANLPKLAVDYSPIDEHTLETEMAADDKSETRNHFLVIFYR